MAHVDCLTCREALSARMDGEDEPEPAEHTDQHLAECAACLSWHVRVTRQSRMLRVREAAPVPDLSATILDTAVPPQPAQGWLARIALIVVAVAQLGLALSQLIGVENHVGFAAHGAGHLLNESTAWNLALGVGLLWAAFRSRATPGLIPVLAGFVVVLAPYSIHDLATGAVPASRVAEHGLLVLALALLVVLNRRYNDPSPRHGRTVDDTEDTVHTSTDETDTSTTGTTDGTTGRPPLRPAGRHHAA